MGCRITVSINMTLDMFVMLPGLPLLSAGPLGKPGFGRVIPVFLRVEETGPGLL
jgi:hypothetical protein